jgi:hypothetical protein
VFYFSYFLIIFAFITVHLNSSNEDEDIPPPKKARMHYENLESMKESTSLSAEDEPTADLPPRRVVAKVKASTVAPSSRTSVPLSSNDHVSISF